MPNSSSVLIIVDVQNSFMPGGSLAVPRGDEVVPVINRLGKQFTNVTLTGPADFVFDGCIEI